MTVDVPLEALCKEVKEGPRSKGNPVLKGRWQCCMLRSTLWFDMTVVYDEKAVEKLTLGRQELT